MKQELIAIATLVGTVIGAGVLGMPYVVAKAGLLPGIFSIFFLGSIVALLNLYAGEIALRTKGRHQLVGYAKIYLGMPGKIVMTGSMVLAISGALTAYIIGVGESLSMLFGLPSTAWSLIFFGAASFCVWKGLKAVGIGELLMNAGMISAFVLLSVFAAWHIDAQILIGMAKMIGSIKHLFLAYGVILFAFIGVAAVPEMRAQLQKKGLSLKRTILIGSAIPLIIYTVFSIVLVGIFGSDIAEISTITLSNAGFIFLILGNGFAVFTMSTSFLTLGLALKWILQYDYKINRHISCIITCCIPLAAFLAGARSFIATIGLTGALAGSIDGVLISLMALRAKKYSQRNPEYTIPKNIIISSALILVFVLGALGYVLRMAWG